MRMLRIEGVIAERLDSVHVEHVLQIVEVPNSNLLNLVRSAEAVKEVQERNLALNSCKVSNGCEIHYFLDIALSEHGKAGLTASHNIGVIAENVKRVGGNRTSRHMENARQALASDLIHIRDHEEQTLRRCIGGRKSTSAK